MAAKTVLITGCSEGGIGDALAREFHRRGHTVFATARSSAKMHELQALGLHTSELDVTSEESVRRAAEAVGKATGGRLDVLVLNAGVNRPLPFADNSLDDLRRVMDTNLLGAMFVAHAFLPLLVAAGGGALIAGVGSTNSVIHPPWHAAYNASKLGLECFLDTLRLEVAPLGVHVVKVVTGAVRSHLFDSDVARASVPEGSWYYPIRDGIEQRTFLRHAQWVEADDYARQVVDDLLAGRRCPDAIWRGGGTFLTRMLYRFGWEGLLDSALMKGSGLSTLKPPTTPPPSS